VAAASNWISDAVGALGTLAASAAGSRSTGSTTIQCPVLQCGQKSISMAATGA
jgi:hypothetical protein